MKNGVLEYWSNGVVEWRRDASLHYSITPLLLAAAPSPTNLIDDLRLLEAPKPLPLIWQLAILSAALALIGLLLWRRARARRPGPPLAAVIAEAREDALAELQKLRGLISVENSRLYAIQVSGVIRRYIERRFGIRAPKRSTEEFLREAQGSARLDERQQRHLAQFLAGCDFLKFAKATAEIPELEQLHQAAVRFVTDTQEDKQNAEPSETGTARLGQRALPEKEQVK